MSRSEFRYNKRRKHYAYLFKDIGDKRKNLILSTKPVRRHNNRIYKNIRLFRHPNKSSNKFVFIIPVIHIDNYRVFENRKLKWVFDKNDKRKIKRIIKCKKV